MLRKNFILFVLLIQYQLHLSSGCYDGFLSLSFALNDSELGEFARSEATTETVSSVEVVSSQPGDFRAEIIFEEDSGETRIALFTTESFKDILDIRRPERPIESLLVKVTCSSSGEKTYAPVINLSDSNNRSPTISGPNEVISIQSTWDRTVPINWNKPIIASDKDYEPQNVKATFSVVGETATESLDLFDLEEIIMWDETSPTDPRPVAYDKNLLVRIKPNADIPLNTQITVVITATDTEVGPEESEFSFTLEVRNANERATFSKPLYTTGGLTEWPVKDDTIPVNVEIISGPPGSPDYQLELAEPSPYFELAADGSILTVMDNLPEDFALDTNNVVLLAAKLSLEDGNQFFATIAVVLPPQENVCTTVTPPETTDCPTSTFNPVTDCPTFNPTTDCPTSTCNPATDCPTTTFNPVTDCPTTTFNPSTDCPSTECPTTTTEPSPVTDGPTISTTSGPTTTECPVTTCEPCPTTTTTTTTESPVTTTPVDPTPTPTTPCPTTTFNPITDCPTTPCPTTCNPVTDCPTTPPCPTTTLNPITDCPTTPCPTTCNPVTDCPTTSCPTTTVDPSQTCAPCPPEASKDEGSKTGLYAGIGVTSVIAVGSTFAAIYFFSQMRKAVPSVDTSWSNPDKFTVERKPPRTSFSTTKAMRASIPDIATDNGFSNPAFNNGPSDSADLEQVLSHSGPSASTSDVSPYASASVIEPEVSPYASASIIEPEVPAAAASSTTTPAPAPIKSALATPKEIDPDYEALPQPAENKVVSEKPRGVRIADEVEIMNEPDSEVEEDDNL